MKRRRDVGMVGRDGWFLRAAGVIGDFGNPFYREERQRDVWNEASAVGLQLVLWLGLAGAAAAVWLGGAEALPYAVGIVALVGVAACVSVGYAHQMGVQLDHAGRVLRLRLVPYVALIGLFVAGTVRAAPEGGFAGGFARGMAVGAAGAMVWLAVTGLRARHREG